MPFTWRNSPRNTLPRPTKRVSMKKSNIPHLKRPSSMRQVDDSDDTTPRCSTFDVSAETGEMTRSVYQPSESASMSSSVVIENGEAESTSPTESRDIVSEMASRCRIGTATMPAVLKAKRIKFYGNGDQYFKGVWYALQPGRVKSMQPLMEDLTKAMADSTALTHGIRHIFTIDGSDRITHIDQFEDHGHYVCSSTEAFKNIDYANAQEPNWRYTLTSRFNKYQDSSKGNPTIGLSNERTDFVYPRIITIIRNGVKPRKVVRHLLNTKTTRSFDQVMTDLTSIVKLDSGAIRKLFGISGRQVLTLEDFFGEDSVFIAYGNERTAADDFLVASEEYKGVASRNGRKSRWLSHRRSMPSRNESLRLDRAGSAIPEQGCHLPLEMEEYFDIVRLIGDGNTALVYEVIDRRDQQRRALKVIGRENAYGKETLIETELRIMQRIQHECIVQMFEYFPLHGSFYISLELVEAGDLFEYLRSAHRVEERHASSMIKCVAEALKYLHANRIVHRDVKLENLLLLDGNRGEMALKLADFGLACELLDDTPLVTVCGTPTYVAPEVVSDQGYNEKVDTWAVGIILYVMLCGFPPFQSASNSEDAQAELFMQIRAGAFNFPSPSWDDISFAARHLICCLISVDPESRFSAENVLNNVWITNGGVVDKEYEAWAQFNVERRVVSANDELEETDYEYFLSRRTSMDELSESGRDCEEFVFQRSYS